MIDAKAARKLSEMETSEEDTKALDEAPSVEEMATQILVNLHKLVTQQASPPLRRVRLMVEPFAEIPGKYHPAKVEDEVMDLVLEGLHEGKFGSEWDRRDKRVVLTITW